MENSVTQKSILKTLCYADIFQFPMTVSEIYKYLISDKAVSKKIVITELNELVKKKLIWKKDDYYFLLNQNKFINERKKRTIESRKKMVRAHKIAQILKFIPTISMIGVSGSLSMNNSAKTDDIDLFIVTKENTIWFTRFMVHLTVFAFKRAKKKIFGMEKICPNMYLPEDNLQIPIPKRNLFTAHEASQLKIVFDRTDVYKKFLLVNPWILKYLPNAFCLEKISLEKKSKSFIGLIAFINKFLYSVQYLYMKRHIRYEEVAENSIRFHNKNKSNYVMDLFMLKYSFFDKKKRKLSTKLFINKESEKTPNTPGY